MQPPLELLGGTGSQAARRPCCMFSINPDAPSTAEIDNMQWAVRMVRKGAVPNDRVLNALTLAAFRAHL